jgi:hypothetical protein
MSEPRADQGGASPQARLAAVLGAVGGALAVAVSGGVDSVTLATFAHGAAAHRLEVFHAVSPAVPQEATERVQRLASDQGWRLRIVDAREFADEMRAIWPTRSIAASSARPISMAASRATPTRKSFRAPISTILENIDRASTPPNFTRFATLISRPASIKRRSARSPAIWDWALYPSCLRPPVFQVGSRPASRFARRS